MPRAVAARAAALAAAVAPAAGKVPVEVYVQSLSHHSQMVMKAVELDVLAAGRDLPYDTAGVLNSIDLTIDFIGSAGSGDPAQCDTVAGPWAAHGPQMCVVDLYHLCAQHPGQSLNSTASGTGWVDYTMCLFSNQNYLKCSPQAADHCGTDPSDATFRAALGQVHRFCAGQAGIDAMAIQLCATSEDAVQMQADVFARSQERAASQPGTVVVAGAAVAGVGAAWRTEVNVSASGAAVLAAVCAASNPAPKGCAPAPAPAPGPVAPATPAPAPPATPPPGPLSCGAACTAAAQCPSTCPHCSPQLHSNTAGAAVCGSNVGRGQ